MSLLLVSVVGAERASRHPRERPAHHIRSGQQRAEATVASASMHRVEPGRGCREGHAPRGHLQDLVTPPLRRFDLAPAIGVRRGTEPARVETTLEEAGDRTVGLNPLVAASRSAGTMPSPSRIASWRWVAPSTVADRRAVTCEPMRTDEERVQAGRQLDRVGMGCACVRASATPCGTHASRESRRASPPSDDRRTAPRRPSSSLITASRVPARACARRTARAHSARLDALGRAARAQLWRGRSTSGWGNATP